MARQKGFIKLTGKIGHVSFYKNKDGYFAKETGGVSKERILTDSNYELTRQNNEEFGSASNMVGMLKGAIWLALKRTTPTKLHGRLVKVANSILRSDPKNARGERRIEEGDWNMLHGFDLNENAKFSNVVKSKYQLERKEDLWELHFEDLHIGRDIRVPKAATHVRLYFITGAFGPGEKLFPYGFHLTETDPLPIESGPKEITMTAPHPVGNYDYHVVTLGMEFLILSGSHIMDVGRLKLNPCRIVKAGAKP
ncbi:hypothetical protein [Litoribacter populi]|uniref:hypothetical protein n=1 Tax=Litoribacter populi TaxID=2598460 RepID=UPI00118051D8|nr:hypothetical protein [Litoribacter populi]